MSTDTKTRIRITAIGLCVLGSMLVDQPPNLDPAAGFPRCYEDEAVVEVISNFQHGAPYSFNRGDLVCIPYDDINGGFRPDD